MPEKVANVAVNRGQDTNERMVNSQKAFRLRRSFRKGTTGTRFAEFIMG